MTIQQLAIFLENKPGHLKGICNALAKANINILTLSIADTEQFGILRLIVREWEAARRILEDRGFVVHVGDVVGVEVDDRPGGMARILDVLQAADLNIEYAYAFTFHRNRRAVLLFRLADPARAVNVLQDAEVYVLKPEDLLLTLGRGAS